jgi:hypothetical protein
LDRGPQNNLIHINEVLSKPLKIDLAPVRTRVRIEQSHDLRDGAKRVLARQTGLTSLDSEPVLPVWPHCPMGHLAMRHLSRLHRHVLGRRHLGVGSMNEHSRTDVQQESGRENDAKADRECLPHGSLLKGYIPHDSMRPWHLQIL